MEVKLIESLTVQPMFEKYGPGVRTYILCDWEDLGVEGTGITSSVDLMKGFDGHSTIYASGLAPIVPELYVAILDFNPDDRERPLDEKKGGGGVRILAYRTGELLLLTLPPNKGGWFEGYRFNDPER